MCDIVELYRLRFALSAVGSQATAPTPEPDRCAGLSRTICHTDGQRDSQTEIQHDILSAITPSQTLLLQHLAAEFRRGKKKVAWCDCDNSLHRMFPRVLSVERYGDLMRRCAEVERDLIRRRATRILSLRRRNFVAVCSAKAKQSKAQHSEDEHHVPSGIVERYSTSYRHPHRPSSNVRPTARTAQRYRRGETRHV